MYASNYISFIFYFSSLITLGSLLGSFAQFGSLDIIIQYLSLSHHYDSIKKGVVVAGDLIFNLSFIVFFLSASLAVIKTLKK
jgi:hypothetical protein